MPVGARVYSPSSYYPLHTNQIGEIHHVACQHSESSYVRPGWSGPVRIKAGVLHYGSQLPVWGPEEPEVGDWVYKTGRTTGTTLGLVVGVDFYVYGFCGIMYDQCAAIMGSGHEDSGAPVYSVDWEDMVPQLYATVESSGIKVADLKGVLFAGISVEGTWYSIFSPIGLVLDDLDVWPLPGPFG